MASQGKIRVRYSQDGQEWASLKDSRIFSSLKDADICASGMIAFGATKYAEIYQGRKCIRQYKLSAGDQRLFGEGR